MKVNEEFEKYCHWRENPNESRDLKRVLYKVLMLPLGKDKLKEFTDHLMKIRKG